MNFGKKVWEPARLFPKVVDSSGFGFWTGSLREDLPIIKAIKATWFNFFILVFTLIDRTSILGTLSIRELRRLPRTI